LEVPGFGNPLSRLAAVPLGVGDEKALVEAHQFETGGLNDAQGSQRQRQHALGMEVFAEKALQERMNLLLV
jgi:hypothetical protein